MFRKYMQKMNRTTDAACAPACHSVCACQNIALNPDTAVEAVSVLILGIVLGLISVIVRMIAPIWQG